MVNTAEGFLDVNGARLYYQEAGSGPALVLVHAGICDHRMWDPQVAEFAENHRTIRYDARGFGRSSNTPGEFNSGADLVGLLGALEIGDAAVVGVSIGSMTAVDFALLEPAMAREIPGARLEVIANAAHLPNLEHPLEFNRMVLEFLAGV